MTPRLHLVLETAIEEGITRGWNVAHKHEEAPHPDRIKEHIYNCVLGSIYEWFIFEAEKNDT